MVAARPWHVHGSCSFIVVAHSWRLLVHGGCLFMAAARSWRPLVHGGCSFMAAARPWRPLVHGGRSSMAATRPWRPLVHGGCSSIVVARLWQFLVYSSCSSMRNCAILKGNSSCSLYDENHMISNHSCVGGAILPRSILHYITKQFAFCQEAFCILPEYFVWLSNRAMMIITNESGHVVVRQLWMGLEISGDFYSIGVTFPGQ